VADHIIDQVISKNWNVIAVLTRSLKLPAEELRALIAGGARSAGGVHALGGGTPSTTNPISSFLASNSTGEGKDAKESKLATHAATPMDTSETSGGLPAGQHTGQASGAATGAPGNAGFSLDRDAQNSTYYMTGSGYPHGFAPQQSGMSLVPGLGAGFAHVPLAAGTTYDPLTQYSTAQHNFNANNFGPDLGSFDASRGTWHVGQQGQQGQQQGHQGNFNAQGSQGDPWQLLQAMQRQLDRMQGDIKGSTESKDDIFASAGAARQRALLMAQQASSKAGTPLPRFMLPVVLPDSIHKKLLANLFVDLADVLAASEAGAILPSADTFKPVAPGSDLFTKADRTAHIKSIDNFGQWSSAYSVVLAFTVENMPALVRDRVGYLRMMAEMVLTHGFGTANIIDQRNRSYCATTGMGFSVFKPEIMSVAPQFFQPAPAASGSFSSASHGTKRPAEFSRTGTRTKKPRPAAVFVDGVEVCRNFSKDRCLGPVCPAGRNHSALCRKPACDFGHLAAACPVKG